MTLSERLIELKNEQKMMQKDIASGINIPLRSYQRYEKGEREPNASILIALADYFNISIDYLVGRTDDNEKKFGFTLSKEALEIAAKYDKVDERSKEYIKDMVEREYQRRNEEALHLSSAS